MSSTAAPGAAAPPFAPPNRLLALTALFYAVFLGVWAYQTATGIETIGTRWALFTCAILLYCALSLAAVARRPDNPQVAVFVATGVSIVATIIWPLPSFDAGYSAAWVAELSIFCLVYTLPVALFVHMAAMIPRPHEGVLRNRCAPLPRTRNTCTAALCNPLE